MYYRIRDVLIVIMLCAAGYFFIIILPALQIKELSSRPLWLYFIFISSCIYLLMLYFLIFEDIEVMYKFIILIVGLLLICVAMLIIEFLISLEEMELFSIEKKIRVISPFTWNNTLFHDELEGYNPLFNLIYSGDRKIMTDRLFNDKFEPQYPLLKRVIK